MIMGLCLVLAIAIVSPVSAQPPTQPLECTTCPCLADTDGAAFSYQGVIFFQGVSPTATGTGLLNPFLRSQTNDAINQGYDTDYRPVQFDETASWTEALNFKDIPIVEYEGKLYREFRLDINQVNSGDNALLSLDSLKAYKMEGTDANLCHAFVLGAETAQGSSDFTCPAGVTQTPKWNLDAIDGPSGVNCDQWIKLNYALEPGSGQSDLWALVPLTDLPDCGYDPSSTTCHSYLYLYAMYGKNIPNNDGFEEWATRVVNAKSGMKFNDLNGNGVKDGGEPGLGGWTIFLDEGNGVFDGPELNTTTSIDPATLGQYQLSGFDAGNNLQFCEVIPAGTEWVQTFPVINSPNTVSHTVDGKTIVCYSEDFGRKKIVSTNNDFGNFKPATKSGVKFEDKDADGLDQETGEPGLAGWTIYVDYNNNGAKDTGEPSAVTSSAAATLGQYTITGIKGGTYKVREVGQTGWTCSFPATTDEFGCYQSETFVSDGNYPNNDFGNWQPASKSGVKFNDLDGDGLARETGEPLLSGWQICISDGVALPTCVTTDINGAYQFTGLKPGVTYTVTETAQTGWVCTYPGTGDACNYVITLNSGEADTDNDFGNNQPPTGCTASPGYWLGHQCTVDQILAPTTATPVAGCGAAPITVGKATVNTFADAVPILDMTTKGYCAPCGKSMNPLSQLYRQVLSAELTLHNCVSENPVSPSVIEPTLTDAENYLSLYTCEQACGKGKNAIDLSPVGGWTTTLSTFNSGGFPGLPECPTYPCWKTSAAGSSNPGSLALPAPTPAKIFIKIS